MKAALQISNLTKKYNSQLALNNLSFEVNQGEIFGLLGPNGAGKTSLISIITTLESASSGEIKVFGYDVKSQFSQTKRMIGVVTQEIVGHGFFNIEEILTFHSGYYGITNNKEKIFFLLNKLGLFEHRHKKISQLSGGMKRRLMIAKALVHSPKLLLLDEPTAGVDISLRESMWTFVQDLKKEGVTILLTTHYLQEAESLCDRIAVINKGQLCTLKTTQEMLSDLTQRKVTIQLKTPREKINHKYFIDSKGNDVSFMIPSKFTLGALLIESKIQTEEIIDMQVREGSLEEAMKLLLNT